MVTALSFPLFLSLSSPSLLLLVSSPLSFSLTLFCLSPSLLLLDSSPLSFSLSSVFLRLFYSSSHLLSLFSLTLFRLSSSLLLLVSSPLSFTLIHLSPSLLLSTHFLSLFFSYSLPSFFTPPLIIFTCSSRETFLQVIQTPRELIKAVEGESGNTWGGAGRRLTSLPVPYIAAGTD